MNTETLETPTSQAAQGDFDTSAPLALLPGADSLLGQMLAWISPTGPTTPHEGLDAELPAAPSRAVEAGFSSARLADEADAYRARHAAALAGPTLQSKNTLRAGAIPGLSSVLAGAQVKAVEAGAPDQALSSLSLHPADYGSLEDYVSSVFAPEFSAHVLGTEPPSPFTVRDSVVGDSFGGLGGFGGFGRLPGSHRDNQMRFSSEFLRAPALESQLLAVVNRAHLSALSELAGTARSGVRITELYRDQPSPAAIRMEEMGEATPPASTKLPGVASSQLDTGGLNELHAEFVSSEGEVIRSMRLSASKDLSGPISLFSLGRSIETSIAAAWEEAFQRAMGAESRRLAGEIAAEVKRLGAKQGPWAQSIVSTFEDLHQVLASRICEAALKHGVARRLSKSYKTILPIPSLNAALKDFNSRLDRTALSHAMRYGSGVRFDYETYRYFCAPAVQAAIAETTYKGAFSLAALPASLLAHLHSSTVDEAQALQAFVRELHDRLDPEVRVRIAKESPQYLLGFRHSSSRNYGGKSEVFLIEALQQSAQGSDTAIPEMAGVIAQGFNLLAQRNVSLRRLPLREAFFRSQPLVSVATGLNLAASAGAGGGHSGPGAHIGLLGQASPLRTAPALGLSYQERSEACALILHDLMARAERLASKSRTLDDSDPATVQFGSSSDPAFKELPLDVYLKAPSMDAILRYRGEVPVSAKLERASADGLRTLLGLTGKGLEEPLTTHVDGPAVNGDAAGSTMNWRLGLIRLSARSGLERDLMGLDEKSRVAGSSLGAAFVVSFVSDGPRGGRAAKPQWIHSVLTVADIRSKRASDIQGAALPLYQAGSADAGAKTKLYRDGGKSLGATVIAGSISTPLVKNADRDLDDESGYDDEDWGDEDVETSSDRSFDPLVTKADATPTMLRRGVTPLKGVIYRGVPGSGQIYQAETTVKLGEEKAGLLAGHAAKLREELCERLAQGLRRDPALFAAVMSSEVLDLTRCPEVKGQMPDVIPSAAGFRAAVCASGTNSDTLAEVISRISNPFHTNARGATLLDIAELAQKPENALAEKPGMVAENPMSRRMIAGALKGLRANAAAQADPVALASMVERSAENCLVKAPSLIGDFEATGVPLTRRLLGVLNSVHPDQVDDATHRLWQAARMQLKIDEATAAARMTPCEDVELAAQERQQPEPTRSSRRRVGL